MNSALTVSINHNPFDALVSVAHRIGTGVFEKSTWLKKLNEADYTSVATQFNVWNKSGGKAMQGHVNRRVVERTLFEKAIDWGFFIFLKSFIKSIRYNLCS